MAQTTRFGISAPRWAMSLLALSLAVPSAWAAMTEPFISYTVQPKDTLQGLTRSLLNDPAQWPEVARLNGLKNANIIRPGQVIEVPKSLLNLASQPHIAAPGKILSVQGDVTLGGQKVQAGAIVPEGARLQTAAGSSAVVMLGDGSRIQLMPKTLAEVVTQHSYALRDPSSSASTTWFSGAIRLVEGVLDALADKKTLRMTPLEVSTPTSLVGVRGTQFRVAYEDPATGVARTEVLEGKVRTDNTKQNTGAEVGGGFGAALKPQEREIKVVALLPALADAQLPAQVLRSDTAPNAAWTVGALAGAAGYRAQFASDSGFAQIQSDVKSATPALDVSSLANGSYYARVRGIDPAGIEGFDAVKQIEIKTVRTSVWPNEISIGAVAQLIPNGVLLKVYNQSPDMPRQLGIQLASDAAFTQDLQTAVMGPDATVALPSMLPGTRWYVRFSDAGVSSPVFTLDAPGNWGTSVRSLVQALQPLR
jgi:hypothetical protein